MYNKAILQGLFLGLGDLARISAIPLLFLVALYAVKYFLRQKQKGRLVSSGLAELDQMEGKTFEIYLEAAFEKEGYQVQRTPYAGDWGADLVISKAGVRTVVQAKRYQKNVGVKAVQEVVASKAKYQCSQAMVVTNSHFTTQAKELARANGVVLWDREALLAHLINVAPTVTIAPKAVATMICAQCGKRVSEKVVQYCQSQSQRFSGQVYCYEHQKSRQRAA